MFTSIPCSVIALLITFHVHLTFKSKLWEFVGTAKQNRNKFDLHLIIYRFFLSNDAIEKPSVSNTVNYDYELHKRLNNDWRKSINARIIISMTFFPMSHVIIKLKIMHILVSDLQLISSSMCASCATHTNFFFIIMRWKRSSLGCASSSSFIWLCFYVLKSIIFIVDIATHII